MTEFADQRSGGAAGAQLRQPPAPAVVQTQEPAHRKSISERTSLWLEPPTSPVLQLSSLEPEPEPQPELAVPAHYEFVRAVKSGQLHTLVEKLEQALTASQLQSKRAERAVAEVARDRDLLAAQLDSSKEQCSQLRSVLRTVEERTNGIVDTFEAKLAETENALASERRALANERRHRQKLEENAARLQEDYAEAVARLVWHISLRGVSHQQIFSNANKIPKHTSRSSSPAAGPGIVPESPPRPSAGTPPRPRSGAGRPRDGQGQDKSEQIRQEAVGRSQQQQTLPARVSLPGESVLPQEDPLIGSWAGPPEFLSPHSDWEGQMQPEADDNAADTRTRDSGARGEDERRVSSVIGSRIPPQTHGSVPELAAKGEPAQGQPQHPPVFSRPAPAHRLGVCLHDWNLDRGAESGDLHFNAGQIIVVLSNQPGSGWSTGQLGNKTGIYPTTYVEELSPALIRQPERRPPPPFAGGSDDLRVAERKGPQQRATELSPTRDMSLHSLQPQTWQPMLERLDSAITRSESVLAKGTRAQSGKQHAATGTATPAAAALTSHDFSLHSIRAQQVASANPHE